MRLCEKCLQVVLEDLKLEEKASIVFILAAQRDAQARKQKFSGITLHQIQNIFRSRYASMETLGFLVRLGLMTKERTKNSFVYSLSKEGQKAGAMILGDEKTKAKVNAFFLIGKDD